MRDQQYPENKVIDLTTSQVWNSDPLSTSVLTENARLIALAKVFGQAAESLIKAVRDWNNRKKQARELSILPDYMLKDICIRRDQISAVVDGKIDVRSVGLSPMGDLYAPVLGNAKDDTRPAT